MSVIEGIRKNARTAKWIGVFLVIAGFLALIAPLAAGATIVTMIGLLLAFAGICTLLLAFRAGSLGSMAMVFLTGALSLLVGAYMIARPGVALLTLTLFLAIYFVVSGIAEIISGLQVKPAQGWGWFTFGGIVSLLLGIIIWRQFPISGAWAIGVLVGIRLLLNGFTLLTIGGAAGQIARAVDDATGG